jgi:predicted RNA-binding protein with PUA-like domain
MSNSVMPKGVEHWLFKEEPDHYSFADLQRDGTTLWEGVKNPLARQNLRKVRGGDLAFYYHTGKEKAIVGVMVLVTDAEADPQDAKGVVVRVRPLRLLPRPVSLAEIKADSLLKDWDLVRLPRLSVMPVTEKQWRRIEQLSETEPV